MISIAAFLIYVILTLAVKDFHELLFMIVACICGFVMGLFFPTTKDR